MSGEDDIVNHNMRCTRIDSQNNVQKHEVISKTLPGTSGWIWSDHTLAIYQNAQAFVEAGIKQHNSRIFLTRLFLKPCVVVADNQALLELLTEKEDHYEAGMDEYYDLFGDNLLFMNGPEATLTRKLLYPLFNEESKSGYKAITKDLVETWISELDASKPFNVYESTKHFALLLNLRLYLGLDHNKEPQLVEQFSSVATTHWHGMCSLPVNIKVPGLKSGFGQGVDAKDELLLLLRERVNSMKDHAFLVNMSESIPSEELQLNHLLVCCCAIIPKVFASVLTSFILMAPSWKPYYQTCSSEEEKEAALDKILLEVMRLLPPTTGGRRVARRDTQLKGYAIPSGMVVHFSFFGAHTDPAVFPEPNKFRPERWVEENKNDRCRMFAFGAGPRECIGKKMIWDIILIFCKAFVHKFEWEVSGDHLKQLKFIPAVRPKKKPHIQLLTKLN
ncbi:putative cytochrome P450 120 [Homarus americanus]|uniref:putative cytochrome P450 120 n=1 Tax=Homarus americanus TaxID=6706 RepID=UPI001C49223E|nr:putative cytochrome P450 120 [Homarus americanus]XP_042226945.1 putative cytochrome P450 120 [Homarus americanus]